MKTIDMTPSHETAARIYTAVLTNPKAESGAIQIAVEEIIGLGKLADERNAFAKRLRKISETVDTDDA